MSSISSHCVVQTGVFPTNHIPSDSHSTDAPARLAVSLNRATNSSTSSVIGLMHDTLTAVAAGGACILTLFLSNYSLREVSNPSLEKESELWKSQKVLQAIGVCIGGLGGSVAGVKIASKLTPPSKASHPVCFTMSTFAGLYLGIILGFLLTQAAFSIVKND